MYHIYNSFLYDSWNSMRDLLHLQETSIIYQLDQREILEFTEARGKFLDCVRKMKIEVVIDIIQTASNYTFTTTSFS